jgi:hypothetical protein
MKYNFIANGGFGCFSALTERVFLKAEIQFPQNKQVYLT